MVYSSALRQTGAGSLVEKVAQNVFAIQFFSGAILHVESESALEWAGRIANQAMREAAVQEHNQKWEA